MKFTILALVLSFCAQAGAQPAASAKPSSVLVTTEMPEQGSLPKQVVGYGITQVAEGSTQTLSLLRAGQVAQVDVRAGEAVKQGQRLLVINAEPGDLATYKQTVAALTLARTQRAHAAQLLAEHLGTTDQLAVADKAVTDARSALDALDRAGGSSPRQAVLAPSDGIVAALAVAPGARIAAQAPLVTFARAGQIVAAIGIEPSQRRLVAAAQTAELQALYDASPVSGRVISVSAVLDPVSRLLTVMVAPSQDNAADGGMMPGSPVRATIQVGELKGWTMPRAAVLTDGQGAYVFQVLGGKAKRVDVQVVGSSAGRIVVDGKLDAANPLVVSGNYQLQDGMAVRETPGHPASGPSTEAAAP